MIQVKDQGSRTRPTHVVDQQAGVVHLDRLRPLGSIRHIQVRHPVVFLALVKISAIPGITATGFRGKLDAPGRCSLGQQSPLYRNSSAISKINRGSGFDGEGNTHGHKDIACYPIRSAGSTPNRVDGQGSRHVIRRTQGNPQGNDLGVEQLVLLAKGLDDHGMQARIQDEIPGCRPGAVVWVDGGIVTVHGYPVRVHGIDGPRQAGNPGVISLWETAHHRQVAHRGQVRGNVVQDVYTADIHEVLHLVDNVLRHPAVAKAVVEERLQLGLGEERLRQLFKCPVIRSRHCRFLHKGHQLRHRLPTKATVDHGK